MLSPNYRSFRETVETGHSRLSLRESVLFRGAKGDYLHDPIYNQVIAFQPY